MLGRAEFKKTRVYSTFGYYSIVIGIER